jgi:predicted AlkP superfamily pyrophosphatase or phosphodiesterase
MKLHTPTLRFPSIFLCLLFLFGLLFPASRISRAREPLVGASTQNRASGGTNRAAQQKKPYVILISFDGFRADYLDRFEAPNFRRVINQGVRAEGLIPVFPSKTFPNHYSIVTGMYAERHGLVANGFYDPKREETYSMSNRAGVRDGSWYGGEPIWVTAEKQGMVTAPIFWPGSEAAIKGVRPTYWKEYDGNASNSDRVDGVLAWLKFPREKRPHFFTLYMSDVDSAGHKYGPGTPEVKTAIEAVDRELGRLLDGVEASPIRDEVYLVIVSDHGMTETRPEQYTAIDSLIEMDGVRLADGGPNANLHISGGPQRARDVRNQLNQKLQHGRAYLRAEVPIRFHYRTNPRIGDVVVIMEEHYQIGLAERAPKTAGGSHGWDPTLQSMQGIFLAMGPGIAKGRTIQRFENIQIYSFMAETLGLRPAPGVQGRPGLLRGRMLQNPKAARK